MTTKSDAATWHCLMLHAAGSSPRALAALQKRLEDEGLRVSTPHLPMQVMPEDRARGAAFAPHVAHARAKLAESGDEPTIIFGHSFGALVALLAILDGARPDLAILYEPIVLSTLDDGSADDRAAKQWDRALIDHLNERVDAGDAEPGIKRFIEAYNEVLWSELPDRARTAIVSDAANIRDVAVAVHHYPLAPKDLRTIDTKIVVMSGSRSLDVAQRMSARVAALLPDASHVIIPEGGHMAPARMPAAIATAILATLAEA